MAFKPQVVPLENETELKSAVIDDDLAAISSAFIFSDGGDGIYKSYKPAYKCLKHFTNASEGFVLIAVSLSLVVT